ncbi:uncharacterized protein PS065_010303 [Dugong dugon]
MLPDPRDQEDQSVIPKGVGPQPPRFQRVGSSPTSFWSVGLSLSCCHTCLLEFFSSRSVVSAQPLNVKDSVQAWTSNLKIASKIGGCQETEDRESGGPCLSSGERGESLSSLENFRPCMLTGPLDVASTWLPVAVNSSLKNSTFLPAFLLLVCSVFILPLIKNKQGRLKKN